MPSYTREQAATIVQNEIQQGLIKSREQADRRFIELGHARRGQEERLRSYQQEHTLGGFGGRLANRFEARTTNIAANLAEMLGIVSPQKAEDVRTIAREIESRYRPAQTKIGKLAGGIGMVGPDVLTAIATPIALEGVGAGLGAAGLTRVAGATSKAAKFLRGGEAAGGVAKTAIRRAAGGVATDLPITILPGALSEDPRQSLTGSLAEASQAYRESGLTPSTMLGKYFYAPVGRAAEALAPTKAGRVIGDVAAMLPAAVAGDIALQGVARGAKGAYRGANRFVKSKIGPSLGDVIEESTRQGVQEGTAGLDRLLRQSQRTVGDIPAWQRGGISQPASFGAIPDIGEKETKKLLSRGLTLLEETRPETRKVAGVNAAGQTVRRARDIVRAKDPDFIKASQILSDRAKQISEAATVAQQKILERAHAAEDATLAGTGVGNAIKTLKNEGFGSAKSKWQPAVEREAAATAEAATIAAKRKLREAERVAARKLNTFNRESLSWLADQHRQWLRSQAAERTLAAGESKLLKEIEETATKGAASTGRSADAVRRDAAKAALVREEMAVAEAPAAAAAAEAATPISAAKKAKSPEVRAAKGNIEKMYQRSKELADQATELLRTGIRSPKDVRLVSQMVDDLNTEIRNLNDEIVSRGGKPIATPVGTASGATITPVNGPEIVVDIPSIPKGKAARRKYISQLRNQKALIQQILAKNPFLHEIRAVDEAVKQIDEALRKAGYNFDANTPFYYSVSPVAGPLVGYGTGYSIGDTPEERERNATVLGAIGMTPMLATALGPAIVRQLTVTHEINLERMLKALQQRELGGGSFAVGLPDRAMDIPTAGQFGDIALVNMFDPSSASLGLAGRKVATDDIWSPGVPTIGSVFYNSFVTPKRVRALAAMVNSDNYAQHGAGVAALRILRDASADGNSAVKGFLENFFRGGDAFSPNFGISKNARDTRRSILASALLTNSSEKLSELVDLFDQVPNIWQPEKFSTEERAAVQRITSLMKELGAASSTYDIIPGKQYSEGVQNFLVGDLLRRTMVHNPYDLSFVYDENSIAMALSELMDKSIAEDAVVPHLRLGKNKYVELSNAAIGKFRNMFKENRLGVIAQQLMETDNWNGRVIDSNDPAVLEQAAKTVNSISLWSAAGGQYFDTTDQLAIQALSRLTSHAAENVSNTALKSEVADAILDVANLFKNTFDKSADVGDRKLIIKERVARALINIRDNSPTGTITHQKILAELENFFPLSEAGFFPVSAAGASKAARQEAQQALEALAFAASKVVNRPVPYFELYSPNTVAIDHFKGFLLPDSYDGELRNKILEAVPDAIIKTYGIFQKSGITIGEKRAIVAKSRGPAFLELVEALKNKRAIAITASGLAIPADAKAQDGSNDESSGIPLGLAIMLAGGFLGRKFLRRSVSAAAESVGGKAARTVIENELERQAKSKIVSRTVAETVRNAERIGQPVYPYPPDLMPDLMDSPESLLRNAPRILNDRAGSDEVREISEGLIESGLVPRGMTVPWEVESQIADMLLVGVNNLATRDPARKLSGPEMLALTMQYKRDINRSLMAGRIANDVAAPTQDRIIAAQIRETLEDRIIQAYTRITRDVQQTGRDMNLLKLVRNATGDEATWLLRAQKLAGGRQLDDALRLEIINALRKSDFVAATAALSKARARAASILDRLGEGTQVFMLASFARPLRDLLANTLNAADRAASLHVVAPILDKFTSVFNAGTRTYTTLGKTSVSRIAKAGIQGAKQSYLLMNPFGKFANTDEGRIILARAAERYNFLKESQLQNPWMRGFAQFVRRSVAAADQPFHEMAFAMSLEGQARALAQAAGKTGSEFEKIVASLADNPSSEMLARAAIDAQEATWQNDNILTSAAKAVSMRGSKHAAARFVGTQAIPFATTPSAMAYEAMSRSPIGTIAHSATALKKMANSELREAGQRDLVRRLATGATGLGWIALGYYLYDSGQMTGPYPSDPNERARMEEEGKVPNAILRNGKWVSMTGLLGPQAMLMSMGAAMHDAMHGKEGIIPNAIASAKASVYGPGRVLAESPFGSGISSVAEMLSAFRTDDEERKSNAIGRVVDDYSSRFVPTVVGQLAQAMDTDPTTGQVISRDVGQAEGVLGKSMASIQSRIPGMRESLPQRISPFGRVRTGETGGMSALFSPMRGSMSFETPLTKALGESGYFPSTGMPDERIGETPEQFRQRRMAQGPMEEQLLQQVKDAIDQGNTAVFDIAGPEATMNYYQTGDIGGIYRAILSKLRSNLTTARRQSYSQQIQPQ